jgi:hypothetical protein
MVTAWVGPAALTDHHVHSLLTPSLYHDCTCTYAEELAAEGGRQLLQGVRPFSKVTAHKVSLKQQDCM